MLAPTYGVLTLVVLWMGLWTTVLQSLGVHAVAMADSSSENRDGAAVGLNTLTTSCSGGCGTSPCVIVGQSSPEGMINCVNNTRCATLNTGQTALCLDSFDGSANTWAFSPAQANDTVGVAPFQRVGLIQLGSQVVNVAFRRAEDNLGPLSSAMDVSSLNVQASQILYNLSFENLELAGLDNALPVNSTLQLNLNNCKLKDMPLQIASGSNLRILDVSSNNITSEPSKLSSTAFTSLEKLYLQGNQIRSFEASSKIFPALTTLNLADNQLTSIPDFVFTLDKLQALNIDGNPLNASSLSDKQFAFLAGLDSFEINGTTPTSSCPDDAIISKLGTSFRFCMGMVGSSSSDSQDGDITVPVPSPTPKSSGSKAGLIVGIVLGSLAVLGLLIFFFLWCRRRNHLTEPRKPTYVSLVSPGAHGHDDSYFIVGQQPLISNDSSDATSDYEIMNNFVAGGSEGLTRLSYNDVEFASLLRVSARSELWLGAYQQQPVVIKRIKTNAVTKSVMLAFLEEVKHMAGMQHPQVPEFRGGLHHPRIVAFRGALWDANATELCAVVEHIPNGSLRDATTNPQLNLSVPKRHAIARQIAEALAFLHGNQITHGRLNAFNILLDADLSAKLSLFSVFHYVRPSPLDVECGVFVAPEVLRGQQPTEKADAFAFGVVLVELDTGESPALHRKRRLSMLSLQDGSEPQSPTSKRTGFSLSPQCSEMMKSLIAACVASDPMRRPTMSQISAALRSGEMTL
ncbi:hypothetical protein Poli38472_006111 [Pythium oligandrum]|uniref:Protein kinase domain-containing protein n=1 Tax=Pythium oligandrum TaxID=41045 RepID=A0A8K1CTH5_PYTOL|nr:hypothetical protein Poli38472_006111 [Pythium oligandrum]|eukprot:TMW68643.1 hypothetical protein Poli38472_006111 [Pythium oligandrum]